MDFTVTVTPAIVVALSLLIITIILRLVSDAKDIRDNSIINRHLRGLGKTKTQKMIGIIVELRKKADTIIPLLDELYAQKYSKQEVIVLVHYTAGKNAVPTLRKYMANHKMKNFHIVTMRSKMQPIDAIKRYSKAALITVLKPEQHLSKHFFDDIALDYSLQSPDMIVLRQQIKLSKTMFSAFEAHIMMWRDIIQRFKKPNESLIDLRPGVVYKRHALMRASLTHKGSGTIKYSSTAAIIDSASVINKRGFLLKQITSYASIFRQTIGLLVSISVILGLAYILITASAQEILILLFTIVGAYLLIYLGILSKQSNYSLLDNFNLILLAPIHLMSYGILYIFGMASAFIEQLHLPEIVRLFSRK